MPGMAEDTLWNTRYISSTQEVYLNQEITGAKTQIQVKQVDTEEGRKHVYVSNLAFPDIVCTTIETACKHGDKTCRLQKKA